MRKIFWQISTTLDGFMEGPDRELDHTAEITDDGFERYATEMLGSIGAMLLGRKTYEVFVDYWPAATGYQADRMNELPKLVFSRTLETVSWNNARLVRENIAEELDALKRQPGGDIAAFGSAGLASSLIKLGLIDKYWILVSPYVIGNGGATFKDIQKLLALKLSKADTWSSGIVALYYAPA